MGALGEGASSWVWRSDRAVYDGPLPLGRRAGELPRRRVIEPPSRRARKRQANEPALSALSPGAI